MNRCPKCKSFRSPGQPCRRCGYHGVAVPTDGANITDPGKPAEPVYPGMVRCNRADVCKEAGGCTHVEDHEQERCCAISCAPFGQPDAKCVPIAAEPAKPEMVRCDHADECKGYCDFVKRPHKRTLGCEKHLCQYTEEVVQCVPVPTPENTFGPVKGIILPDQPADCAECDELRKQIDEYRAGQEALRQDLERVCRELDNEKDHAATWESTATALLERAEQAEGERDKLREDLGVALEELTETQKNLERARRERDALRGYCGKANAALIAEAGTVATETGLSPRQLAERVEELKKACTEAANELRLDPTRSTAYNVAADLAQALAATAGKGAE